MTLTEYLAIPRDNRQTLLLYGKRIELPRPAAKRNTALYNLGMVLDRWIRHRKKGDLCVSVDLVLDREKALVHAPDLTYVATARKPRPRNGRLHGPADLCIDIIEARQPDFVACRRFADYQHYGVRWYWSWHLNSNPAVLVECHLISGRYECRNEIVSDQWFEPGVFPGLTFRLPPLLEGDLKAAVKGKAKKLM